MYCPFADLITHVLVQSMFDKDRQFAWSADAFNIIFKVYGNKGVCSPCKLWLEIVMMNPHQYKILPPASCGNIKEYIPPLVYTLWKYDS